MSVRGRCLLLILTLAGVAPLRADEGLFSGCKIREDQPGQLIIDCEGLLASANPGQPGMEESLLEGFLNGLREALRNKLTVTSQKAEVRVAGSNRPGLRYSAYVKPQDDAPAFRGLAAVVPVGAGEIRLISCGAATAKPGGDSRCNLILESLATSLPAPTSAPTTNVDLYGPEGNQLAGRTLVVPSGCSVGEPGKISCPTAELNWKPGFDVPFSVMWEPMKTYITKLGTLSDESKLACRIEGTPTECRTIKIRIGEENLFVLAGMASARGQFVAVQCTSATAFDGAIPSPCGQVLSK